MIKTIISRLLRITPLGEWLMDWYPISTKFYDDKMRTVPRQIDREFKFWRNSVAEESRV
jgi:hypothetical protein